MLWVWSHTSQPPFLVWLKMGTPTTFKAQSCGPSVYPVCVACFKSAPGQPSPEASFFSLTASMCPLIAVATGTNDIQVIDMVSPLTEHHFDSDQVGHSSQSPLYIKLYHCPHGHLDGRCHRETPLPGQFRTTSRKPWTDVLRMSTNNS